MSDWAFVVISAIAFVPTILLVVVDVIREAK